MSKWKAPLPFIQDLYFKRFGRERPETVVTLEQRARQVAEKKAARQAAKAARRSARDRDRSTRVDPARQPGDVGGSEADTAVRFG